MSHYGIKTECNGAKCASCGGALQHDPDMKTYYCTECGQIDDSFNLQSTWQGSLGSGGAVVNELGEVKGSRGKKWPGTEYKTRQRNKLRDHMKTISNQLGFSERHINEVFTHLDSYFNYQRKNKRRPKKVATFKTLGMNQACLKACCVIQYLVARKHKMALSIPEVCHAWNLQTIQIGQLLRYIERVEKLFSIPLPPIDFIPRILGRARVMRRTEKDIRILDFQIAPHLQKLTEEEKEQLTEKCKKLLAVAECCNSVTGRSAITIACAVLHLSCEASRMDLSQDTLCRNYDITTSCLSKRVRETKKQLLDLMEEQTGTDMSKIATGATFGWLIEHSKTLIQLKYAKNKNVSEQSKNALKRKLDGMPLSPPSKRKKTKLAVTLSRQQAVAKAYLELKKKIPGFRPIEAYEDKGKTRMILQGANVSKTDLDLAKRLLQLGVSPSDIIQSSKSFHQLVKMHEKKPALKTENNSDGSDIDDVDDSDLDQYFRD